MSHTDERAHSAEAPHSPAAFINVIAEEGTKAEAIEYLQKEWNENCSLRRERVELLDLLKVARGLENMALDQRDRAFDELKALRSELEVSRRALATCVRQLRGEAA